MMRPVVCQQVEMLERALFERKSSAQVPAEPVPEERALALAEGVLALSEPWRSRFLALIARYARVCLIPSADPDTADVLDGEGASGSEVVEVTLADLAEWLADADLHERIGLMLRAWTTSSR